jgi:hypothetical protein
VADVDVLRVLASVVFLFFVPGYFLWKALVPRPKDVSDELPEIYTAAFSMALSVGVVILTGIALGMLPPDPATGKGYLQLQYWMAALLSLTAVFAAVAWYRGAFPRLGRVSKGLERRPSPPPDGTGVADDPKRYWREQDLLTGRREIRAQLKKADRSAHAGSKEKGYYQKRRAELTQELVEIDGELSKLRSDRDQMVEKAEEEAIKAEGRRRERRDTLLRFLRLKRAEPTGGGEKGK